MRAPYSAWNVGQGAEPTSTSLAQFVAVAVASASAATQMSEARSVRRSLLLHCNAVSHLCLVIITPPSSCVSLFQCEQSECRCASLKSNCGAVLNLHLGRSLRSIFSRSLSAFFLATCDVRKGPHPHFQSSVDDGHRRDTSTTTNNPPLIRTATSSRDPGSSAHYGTGYRFRISEYRSRTLFEAVETPSHLVLVC